ncbi:YraN family protein [Moraxella caviae]|uniref:UPF0102 protein B0181_06340 n=1 Tax=Moraxella caviae TaxID=34060 RepID=A0A1T0A1W6_9GAMM|nr:YraN family protein [Moraxella caviae]
MGDYFEQQAVEFLQAQGLTIIARNYHAIDAKKIGEIDIIATSSQTVRGRAQNTLIFVEVRARKQMTHAQFATSLETITPTKRRRIIAAAEHFLQQSPKFAEYDCRFDVVAFDVDEKGVSVPQWIVAAFLAY